MNDDSTATTGNNESRRSDAQSDTTHAVDLHQRQVIEQAQPSSSTFPSEAEVGGPDAEGREAGRPEVVGKDERGQLTGVAGMSGQQRSELGMDRIADQPADRDESFVEEKVR